MSPLLTLAERIRSVAALQPDAEAIEQGGAWHTWQEMATSISQLEEIIGQSGLGPGTEFGMLLRNRPHHIHAMAAVLASSGTIVTMNARQPAARTEAEIVELRLPAVIVDRSDLASPELEAAIGRSGALGIAIDRAELSTFANPSFDPPAATGDGGIAVKMLTSGTTGPPKRIAFGAQSLKDSVLGAARLMAGPSNRRAGEEPELLLRRGIIANWAPVEHVSGMWRAIEHMTEGRRLCLLETFEPSEWARVVKTYGVRMAMLAPTTMRMLLDSEVTPDDLASLKGVTAGTAPLSVDLEREFEETFGIPVLPAYGATEFPGNGAGWTLADHERFGASKIGSVGKARPGVRIRVVDQSTGEPAPAGEVGLVEILARTPATPPGEQPDWQRTADLGRLDEDEFLWIAGRADSAIIRGGFKILATDVVRVLEQHGKVKEASVVGLPDERLGAVPVAAVIPNSMQAAPTAGELEAHCRAELVAYMVPAEFRVVEDLPRTSSLKVSMPAVQDLFVEAG